jgi:hypothetical protein
LLQQGKSTASHPAESTAGQPSVKRSQTLFTLSIHSAHDASSNPAGPGGRRATKDLAKERERRVSVNRTASLTVPAPNNAATTAKDSTTLRGATASTSPVTLPPPHRHPYSSYSFLRSIYLLPLCELARRTIAQQGTTVESVLSVAQLLTSKSFLGSIPDRAKDFVVRGGLPLLNVTDPSLEAFAIREPNSTAKGLPLPLISLHTGCAPRFV